MSWQNPNHIETLIIHCAATPNGRRHTAADIDRWHHDRGFHRNPRLIGWQQPNLKHIGYHFVIHVSGAVESGRGIGEVGAHARGHNHNCLGSCLIGTDQFTLGQWHSLRSQVQYLQKQLPGLKTIIGHNQVNADKACPGFDVQAWLAGGMQPLDGHILDLSSEPAANPEAR